MLHVRVFYFCFFTRVYIISPGDSLHKAHLRSLIARIAFYFTKTKNIDSAIHICKITH